MATTLTSKGMVPGTAVEFSVNATGDVVLRPAHPPKAARRRPKDRFDAVRGHAGVPWRTDELMKLLSASD